MAPDETRAANRRCTHAQTRRRGSARRLRCRAQVTCALRGDSWVEFTGVAAYSIGWTLLTFGVLYLLSKQFENWEWGRPDHDLAARLQEGLDNDEHG
jgi:hypothetical protein